MTNDDLELQEVLNFVERYKEDGVESTGATAVNFTGGLYNVSGSTNDPKRVPGRDGVTWKQLLIAYGINGNCYVTNTNPVPGASHPSFSVGGHMTTISSGIVPTGGECYLMPLCSWHNSTARDGILYHHTNTAMLKLSGYDQGELAATFQLRLPSNDPFAILYPSDDGWHFKNLSEHEAASLETDVLPQISRGDDTHYVLVERVRGERTMHYIRDVKLPSFAKREKTLPTNVYGAVNETDVQDTQSSSPTDMLYQAFANLYGNSNPRQLFSLVWPGTVLDPSSYSYDGTTEDAAILGSIAQSKLFDQHYPIATITQPDGTKVSDRYQQAINQYGPIPNALLAQLQSLMQERLSQVTQMNIGGQVVTMTVLDQYSYLNGQWLAAQQNWAQMQADKMAALEASGASDWWAQYVAWYAIVAPAQIDAVNAAHDRLLAEFPLNQYQDAIAILSIQEAAALLRARDDLTQATMDLPPRLGSSVVISSALPANWGNTLNTSTTFIDLLSSPDAQQKALNNTITYLQQQIYAWNAVLAQIPAGSAADIQKALDAFNTASTAYNSTITVLLNTYTNNAVLAVQIYAETQDGTSDTEGVNNTLSNLNAQNPPNEPKTQSLTPEQITDIADKVGRAQTNLIGANASMVSAGTDLARKATQLLQTQAGAPLKGMITPIINQLSSQLQQVQSQSAGFVASCVKNAMLIGKGASSAPSDPNDPKKPPKASDLPEASSSPENLNWQYVTIDFKQSSMSQASSTSTYFSQMNWSVDLFFGSAGGQSTTQGASFASKYLSEGGTVTIGMLATKVLIERPWMHPEIFNMSENYFRISSDPVTTPDPTALGFKEWSRGQLLSTNLNGDVDTAQATNATIAINEGPFPAYPVALLLAKDITINIQCNANETTALSEQSQSNSTQGGGFLCFSVSQTQSSSSNINQAGSFAMAGTYSFRIAAPQVIGAWLQITSDDKSSQLDPELAAEIAGALGFVTKLQNAVTTPRARLTSPVRPS